MRIGKGEGLIPCDRDMLTQGRQGDDRHWRMPWWPACEFGDHIHIRALLRPIGSPIDEGFHSSVFLRLNQTEMALRQSQIGASSQSGENRDAERGERLAQKRLVPVRADAVENHTRERKGCAKAGKTGDERGDRMALLGAIDDEQDAQIQHLRQIGRRAGAIRRAVEQTHHRLDDEEIGIIRRFASQIFDEAGAHGPWIEIDARRGAGGFVKGRVDVIGARLGRGDLEAAPDERGDQGERHRRLSGARRWGCDEKSAHFALRFGLSVVLAPAPLSPKGDSCAIKRP